MSTLQASNSWRLCAALLLAVSTLTACGGGGGDAGSGTPPPPAATLPPAGLHTSADAAATGWVVVDPNGTLVGRVQNSGPDDAGYYVDFSGVAAPSSTSQWQLAGVAYRMITAITGRNERATTTLTLSLLSSGALRVAIPQPPLPAHFPASIEFSRNTAQVFAPASLGAVAGRYAYGTNPREGSISDFTVAADGRISGTGLRCTMTGTLAVSDAANGLYRASVTLGGTNCAAALAGPHTLTGRLGPGLPDMPWLELVGPLSNGEPVHIGGWRQPA